METISYQLTRQIPVLREVDVVVAGGGPGGLGASVMAARAGARTVLLERYGAMGGMAFYGEIQPFMPNHASGAPLDGPVYGEWMERMLSYLPPGARRNYTGGADPHERTIAKDAASLAAEDLALAAGVDIVYHHTVTDAIVENRAISLAVTHSKSGFAAFRAACFVDATGDGDLAVLAGNAYEYGDSRGDAQPMTLCFKLSGIKLPGGVPPGGGDLGRELTRIYLAARERGEIDCPREDVLLFDTHEPGTLHFNTTRVIRKKGIDGLDLSDAEKEGRRQMRQLLELFRREAPGFAQARLHSMAAHIGVRETRRVLGRAYATRDWFAEARKEPDAVARVHYPIDIHNPAGSGTEMAHLHPDDWYEIPYGCVVARDVDNLTLGGRSISVDHALHSSLRVMPPVVSLGQAAGLAAARAALAGTRPARLDGADIRAGLREMGAFL